jgi:hypothetical protein
MLKVYALFRFMDLELGRHIMNNVLDWSNMLYVV